MSPCFRDGDGLITAIAACRLPAELPHCRWNVRLRNGDGKRVKESCLQVLHNALNQKALLTCVFCSFKTAAEVSCTCSGGMLDGHESSCSEKWQGCLKRKFINDFREFASAEGTGDCALLPRLISATVQVQCNLTPHTSHLTPHTSHLTPHTSHLTPHTSHLTPHTSHLTPHTNCSSERRRDGLDGRLVFAPVTGDAPLPD
jgi:hypothetical protein